MIGKIERVLLRQVWKKEAKDFSTWLYDNMDALGEELDISLNPVEKEKNVGAFSADIIAEDESGQKVLIENQLEKTDHDHLGKILTYVSNLEAKIAIWISSEPRPEHSRAIDWLNETNSDVDFYLVKIEAYRIGNSDPAPKFTVIAGPSEKTKAVGEEKQDLAARHEKRLAFWKALLDKSKQKTSLHANISPCIHGWIGAGAGKGGMTYNYAMTYKQAYVELYIDRGKGTDEENKRIFDQLHTNKREIESVFGGNLQWQRMDNRRASRIRKTYNMGLNDSAQWNQLQDHMIDGMIGLDKALGKHIKALKL